MGLRSERDDWEGVGECSRVIGHQLVGWISIFSHALDPCGAYRMGIARGMTMRLERASEHCSWLFVEL